MDLLSRLERALEDVVEGVFSRVFRTQLQPLEVAKRLTREVEAHRTVSVSAVYVPNVYTVALSPDTFEAFQAISGRLLGELEAYLREFTAERQYQTVGPIAVRLAEGEGLKASEMQVAVENDPSAVPSRPTPTTARTSAFSVDAARHAPLSAVLEITAGESAGRIISLVDGLTIGRDPSNLLALHEREISRRHAEIIRQEEGWVLRDVGSTNGILVNGRRITSHVLRVGDTITIGQTVMAVK